MSKRAKKPIQHSFLDRLNALTTKQVAIIFVVIGLIAFAVGLGSPFQGDDNQQIVDSTPVHSLGNIGTLFNSSTFYNGQELTGSYYRPIMTTSFAIIYTIFGAHPFGFHLVQLALYIASALLLYQIFRHFLVPCVALFLSLIFLVHPLNSQVVYAIPSMQDALFFFFGALGLWVLMNYKSINSMWVVAGCLLLSLLSKEVGVVFVLISILYIGLFDKGRLKLFLGVTVIPVALYTLLRAHAIGLFLERTYIAPIDSQSLAERIYSIPSIVLFYIAKLVFPWELGTRYYWTHSSFSVQSVLIPMLIDLVVIGALIYLGIKVRKNGEKNDFRAFIFFAVWMVLGLLPYLQFIPLDMTACINWFYFSMAGLLGMIGISIKSFKLPVSSLAIQKRLAALLGVYLVVLGVSTIWQGTYYSTPYKLAKHDVAVSKDNYAALNEVARGLIRDGKYEEAAEYAQRSINIQPTLFNYQNLGVALQYKGDYDGAVGAYTKALKYGSQSTIYENLGLLTLAYGSPADAHQTLQKGLTAYPQNLKLWLYLALLEDSQGHNDKAQEAITAAAQYGNVPPQLTTAILNNQPFTIPLPNSNKSIIIH